MSQEPLGQSNEYVEQQMIEAIATRHYPGRRIKEIRPGFYADEGKPNYVWIVLLEPTEDPFDNTLTTVDSDDIRAWQEQQKNIGLSDFSVE